jgi:hypothetical protein
MQRSFRATLPNGITVRITPYLDSNDQQIDLAAAAATLAEMLDSRGTSERDLLSFLANMTSTIFPEADPGSAPRLMDGPVERGADLIFEVRSSPGIGAVQIKTPHLNSPGVLETAYEQIKPLLEHSLFDKPVSVVYLISGRRAQLPKMTPAPARRDHRGTSVVVLSWDDVVDRLCVEEPDSALFEVLVVEVIRLSRRLLQAILSNPMVLAGIDDRKFEELVATLLFDLGLHDVHLTPPRKDGGRDVVIEHLDPATGHQQRYLVECKHWVSGNKVTMRWALSLLAVARKENATGAILLSSSGFGPRLLEQEISLSHKGLFLKDQNDLLRWGSVRQRQYGSIVMQSVDPNELLEPNDIKHR